MLVASLSPPSPQLPLSTGEHCVQTLPRQPPEGLNILFILLNL